MSPPWPVRCIMWFGQRALRDVFLMRFPKPSSHNGPPHPDLKGCIDLHMHSTASDGALKPEELVDWAASLGLKAIALTDHDTTAGVDRAMARGREVGVEVIPATEISVGYSGGTFHLLAYFVDHHNGAFNEKLQTVVASRKERNRKIVAALSERGMSVTERELLDEAGEAVVGRPHIARVMMRKGYVEEFREAFDLYLGEGKPCYFPKDDFAPKEAIATVLEAGGVPVLAHALWLGKSTLDELDTYVTELKSYGLKGMEVVYSDHSPDLQAAYRAMAAKHGLLVTGGSDFHGGVTKPEVTLGHGPGGGFHIPGELLEPLRLASHAA